MAMNDKLFARKKANYERLGTRLEPYAELDLAWAEADDPRWHEARKIDDWLVWARTEDEVPELAYRAKCAALLTLYSAVETPTPDPPPDPPKKKPAAKQANLF